MIEAELIVELIVGLAWPATVFTALLVFRRELRAVVARVGRLRYGEFEADFHDVISEGEGTPELEAGETRASLPPASLPRTEGELQSADIALWPSERDLALLTELALLEAEREHKVEVKRHVHLFSRSDLAFHGATIKDDTLIAFEVVPVPAGQKIPAARLDALDERASAVSAEERKRSINGRAVLIVLVVTNAEGEEFSRIESRLRGMYDQRMSREVRIYHESVLWAHTEPDEEDLDALSGNPTAGADG